MCHVTSPQPMPIDSTAIPSTPDPNMPGGDQGAALQTMNNGPRGSVSVNKPTKFGRALEIGTGGAYDPTGGEDTSNPPAGKPTKFGALLNILRPAMMGAAIGGLTGRSTPGGGFAGANQFFMNQRMRQMQISQFMMQQAHMQSEIAKNQAETQWAQRRPLLTRTANTVKGKDASGNDVYMSQNPNTGEWEPLQGVTPEGQEPDYQTVPTDKGIVKYDKRGIAPTVPLTLAEQTEQNLKSGNAESAGEPSRRAQGPPLPLPGGMQTPGQGSSTAAHPSPAAIQGSVPLQPFGKSAPTASKPTRVTNRNAAGMETESIIDENPQSPTFGQTLRSNVASRSPVPDRTNASEDRKTSVSARVETYADEALRQSGGDPDKAIAFLDTITGKIGDKNALQEYRGMLPQIRGRIRERVKPGRSGRQSRLSPADAQSLGLQPGTVTNEDEDQQ